MRPLPFLLALFICSSSIAVAAPEIGAPGPATVLTCAELLLEDGHVLRLDGIAEPFAETENQREQCHATLAILIDDRKLAVESPVTDRYGNLAGQIYVFDESRNKIWLQGELLRQGLAFVYPPTGAEARLADMRAIEAAARSQKTGIWADPVYADLAQDKVWRRYGRFAFVSGTVLDAKRIKSIVYVHFGNNWRESFTLAVPTHDLRAFRKEGIDVESLAGKTIRVRGWVKRDIGPMIEATDPGQVEILTP